MTITVHYFPTPNGRKVTIALEEMGLVYALEPVNILTGEQTQPDFLRLSPNGRIPALVDDDPADGGDPVILFESGAILQYLARKTGLFCPAGEAARARVEAWLFWQMAGLGPMTGQVTWFRRAAKKEGRDPAETSLAIHRYEKEMRRLYDVLERQLTGRDFICDDYSIADMACWPWVHQHHDYLGSLDQFPAMQRWFDRIAARPAVARALAVGMPR
jgi:GST-like protein